MKTKAVLKSKHTNEYFRMIWKGEMIWTEFPLMAHLYDTMLEASMAAISMSLEHAVEPKLLAS